MSTNTNLSVHIGKKSLHFGYTLIELLMAMSINMSLLLCSVPILVNSWPKWDAKMLFQRLELALKLAQSEALRYRTTVQICPSANGQTCQGQWQQGFMVKRQAAVVHYFKGSFYPSIVNLKHFGPHRSLIEVQPSGFTHHNGHFEYYAIPLKQKLGTELYFNHALLTHTEHTW